MPGADAAAATPLIPAEVHRYFDSSHSRAPLPRPRRRLSDRHVSQDDSGLQMLAREGCWAAVVQLAERLEQAAVDPATTAKRPEVALRYVLVRVTAYIKMAEHDKALQTIDRLGNLHSDHYRSLSSGRTVAPFSLLFLHAVLPAFAPAWNKGVFPELALSRLQELHTYCDKCLAADAGGGEECEANKSESSSNGSGGSGSARVRMQWLQRKRRIKRAMIGVFFDLKLFADAVQCLRDLYELASDDAQELVLLQQLGCFCLRCGNLFLAMEVFRQIDTYKVDGDHPEVLQEALRGLLVIMRDMNRAFLLVSAAKFTDAHEIFSKRMILEGEDDDATAAAAASRGGKVEASRSKRAEDSGSDSSEPADVEQVNFIEAVRRRLHHFCGSSSLVLQPYIASPNNDTDSSFTIQPTVRRFDAFICDDARTALGFDSTVYNVSLLYTLEGDDASNKRALLETVMETFRCSREAVPRLNK